MDRGRDRICQPRRESGLGRGCSAWSLVRRRGDAQHHSIQQARAREAIRALQPRAQAKSQGPGVEDLTRQGHGQHCAAPNPGERSRCRNRVPHPGGGRGLPRRSPGSWLAWIVVGLIAGAIAARVVAGRGFGCIADIVVGVAGAIIGGFLLSALFGATGTVGFWGSLVVAFIGAAVLLAVLKLVSSGRL